MAEKFLNDEELSKVEANIVDALLEAAAYRNTENNRRLISIKRNGKILFKFAIESIDEDTWRKCRRQNLLNKGRRSEELDNARFLAQAIYEATIPEDQSRVWNNQEIWRKLNVASGTDVVNLILTPAEKTRLAEVLEELGGYDDDLEDMVKNL